MKFVPNTISRAVFRQVLLAQKHSPRIMFVAGVTGAVASTVLACRATLKLEEVVDEIESDVHNLKLLKTDIEQTNISYNRQLVVLYGKSGLKVARLYAPAVVVGSLSLAALTGSHVTLSRRNASLTAAYAALSQSFEDYRQRVRDELKDDDKELALYRGVELGVNEKGKPDTLKLLDPNKHSVYAKLFDEYNVNWKKDAELNRIFVQVQQNYINHIFQVRGHVFLNEVYDMLGIDRTRAGQVVGWVLSSDGDNYISFGVFDNPAFIGGWERSVLLDFNVNGVIWDKI